VTIAVAPEAFTMVDFDRAEITKVAEQVAAEVGLGRQLISLEIDERSPLSRIAVRSIDPIEITVEGGAFEDLRRIRQLSPVRVVDGLGLHLLQIHDRLDPAFGAPPLDADLPLAHRVAWEVYAMGRLARLGHRSQRQRRLYHFRNRHGFTDAADAAFDRLWDGQDLCWADITSLSDQVRESGQVVG